MSMSATDYAHSITQVVQASAQALSQLNQVLEQQQRQILELTERGKAHNPSASAAMGTTAPLVTPPAMPSVVTPGTAQPEPTPTTPTTAADTGDITTPAQMLAITQQMVNGMIDQAPEVALAQVYQMSAHAIGLALINTVAAQQQLNIVAQTVLSVEASHRLSAT